jgi:protein-L-isoaspartate(D-aspartate) O-methyltransferase
MSVVLIPPLKRERGLGMTSQRARDRMLERLRQQGIRNEQVLRVMGELPRHAFVDEALSTRAYDDTALPIGLGQTISQPYVVARMSEALIEAGTPKKVLDIGTGCGYQAAVLAALGMQVYTVERIEELLRGARRRFRQLGFDEIRSRHADGQLGWPEEGPFDGIVLAAAGAVLAPALLEQLSSHGVVIAPIGSARDQRLYRFQRVGNKVEREDLGAVVFVPLLGGLQ